MMKRFMLTCRDAARLLSKKQDQALAVKERWALKVHLLFCASCRRYVWQIRWMDNAFRLLVGKWSSYRLSAAAKARILDAIKHEKDRNGC